MQLPILSSSILSFKEERTVVELGAAVVVGESEGEGTSVEDVALSEGDGATAGDVTDGDGELPAGDGLLPDGEGAPAGVGLPAAAQTLSAVVEPVPLSTSVVALHVVQFVHAFWLVAVENVPVGHASQMRSEVLVPLEAIL